MHGAGPANNGSQYIITCCFIRLLALLYEIVTRGCVHISPQAHTVPVLVFCLQGPCLCCSFAFVAVPTCFKGCTRKSMCRHQNYSSGCRKQSPAKVQRRVGVWTPIIPISATLFLASAGMRVFLAPCTCTPLSPIILTPCPYDPIKCGHACVSGSVYQAFAPQSFLFAYHISVYMR